MSKKIKTIKDIMDQPMREISEREAIYQEFLLKKGVTYEEIAEQFGVSKQAIFNNIRRHGSNK